MSETPRVSKAFQIEVLKNRKLTETIMRPVKDKETGNTRLVREERTRVVPESFMVYFPAKHSIWVESRDDLVRLGLTPDRNVEIDLETGLPVTPPVSRDLKAEVERSTMKALAESE